MRIGIDLMGSDSSPSTLFQAVREIADSVTDDTRFVVFVTQDAARSLTPHPRVAFQIATQVITMSDLPVQAVRRKRDASMSMGIRLLRDDGIDAFVTAGNTGALIAASTLTLPLLPGVDRPALLAQLPTESGAVSVLDVGGNVSCKPHQMIQFCYLGGAYQSSLGTLGPIRVGLLNVGVEATKGTSRLRQIYDALGDHFQSHPGPLQFVGNVEGREVYAGKVDVLITDGFTGNIFLKASEGVSSYILDYLKQEAARDPSSRLTDVLRSLEKRVDYAEYPGALVCGLERVVIKCHGYSNQRALASAIRGAMRAVESKLIDRMRALLA